MTERTPLNPFINSAINASGPPGESLFWDHKVYILARHAEEMLSSIRQMWIQYQGIGDHRLLSLVGGLCVESMIDDLLQGFIPDYALLRKGVDFTFSMKINLARAMRIMPSWILTSCDLIRTVRNEFAHHLETVSFAQLDSKLLRKFGPHVRQFRGRRRNGSTPEGLYVDLVSCCIWALVGYTYQAKALREYLEATDLSDFRRYVDHQATERRGVADLQSDDR